MTVDEIIARLRTAEALPTDALRAAVPHAADLADPVLSLAQKMQDGVYLLPEEKKLFLYGVHVLAATRNEDLYATLLALMERDEHVLEHIFGDHNIYALTRLLLSTYDNDDAALFERLHHRGTPDDLRWIIFGLITRLTWDGHIARDGTIAFLRRFAEDPLADDDDMVWHGREDAVVLLGLEQLQPQLEDVWRKAVFRPHREIDRQDARDMLQTAAANPEDEAPLIENGLSPIDDPAEALSWVERMAEHSDVDANAAPDDDPAISVRLSSDELDWLAGFLMSEQVPDMNMNLEMLDGYFTALVVGPTPGTPWRHGSATS